MKRLLLVLLVLSVVVGGMLLSTTQANAQQAPSVAGLTPFSPGANYMSLPGYLRWQIFMEQGTWISREEAIQMVDAQLGGGEESEAE